VNMEAGVQFTLDNGTGKIALVPWWVVISVPCFFRCSADLFLERRITDQMDVNEVAFVHYVYLMLIGSEMCSVLVLAF